MLKKFKKGFTLIELVVVMAIIAVLALIIIGAITLARRSSLETVHRGNARTVQTALEASYTKAKAFCPFTGVAQDLNADGDTLDPGEAAATMACNTTVSLGTAASAMKANLSNGCDVSGKEEGGTVTVTPSSYIINVYDYNCLNELENDTISSQ